MKRFFLIGLAALCAVAAIAVALYGFNAKPKPEIAKTERPTFAVVVAQSALPPGHLLQPEDLKVMQVSSLPVNTYASPTALTGRVLAQPTVVDQPVTLDMLAHSHPIVAQLREGERAVALQTSYIIGVGGHLRPGDHVDLLVFLRGQPETADQAQALLALSNLRVLSYEDILPEEPATKSKEAAKDEEEEKKKQAAQARPTNNRSVVLAVPQDQVSRLLLAVESGEPRLALRPQETRVAVADTVDLALPPVNAVQAQKLTLSQMSFNRPPARQSAPVVAAGGAARKPAAKPRPVATVQILEGDQAKTVSFAK